MLKEQKIATYSALGKRIQLLKITELDDEQLKIKSIYFKKIKYQIRSNRKIILKTDYESIARKKFESLVTTEILQQKFSF